MTKVVADVPMREITGVIDELTDKALYAWKRQAQKQAIIGWRDSETPPGAAARFTQAGAEFYHFSGRKGKMRKTLAARVPYVETGTFRDQIRARQPRSKNAKGGYQGGDVVTTISIDGAVLNLLSHKFGYIATHRDTKSLLVEQPAYEQFRAGHPVHVAGSRQRRLVKKFTFTDAPTSYRDEFQLRPSDLQNMEQRSELAMREIVRSAAFTKSGRLKTSIIGKFRTVEDA